ncbi:methionyl-tRNA formyltransferase [Natrinema halophilum]|uniref:phosphoribosylglycinamide formyltransferase 1 n=1 Tax=Natrinema halophilum TaxID=1699371 RepID=A0A7D5H6V7_9EURY|nr:formyltransferase family protein [Natrinema halophilum]QLG48895.1 formyl transferase [Natrinema halophilum]
MSETIDIVFLGINDAGMRVYEWLCERDDVFVHSLLTTREQLQTVEAVEPDYVVSCGYRHIVPQEILKVPTEGCLNLHPSLLPYNRGANPNVWSIVEGTPAGVTIHYMDAGLDTGDIVAQRNVEQTFSDTGKTLQKRLENAQVALFKESWPDIIAGDVVGDTQDPNAGTYHRTAEFDGLCELDPEETVQVKPFIDRLRALTYPPYDNARIEVDGETYTVEVDITKM